MKIPNGYVILSAIGTTFGGIVIFKDYFSGGHYLNEDKIIGKTVIVTGANTGIGKETAKELANRGGRIILACRDLEKCDLARKEISHETYNKNVECRHLDLSSIASIRAFANRINEEESHLDVLINNAGVMACPKSLTKDGFEWQLGVNHLGHFLLTNLLLDKLKLSNDARIINLTSPQYKNSVINFDDLNSIKDYNAKQAYGQSKLANVLFTVELAKRLEGTNVKVNCVNPGVVNTNIGRHMAMAKSTVSGGMLSPGVWMFLKTPHHGAQTPIYLAVEPSLANVSGKYFKNLKEEKITKCGSDAEAARRLWLISEKWTRLTS